MIILRNTIKKIEKVHWVALPSITLCTIWVHRFLKHAPGSLSLHSPYIYSNNNSLKKSTHPRFTALKYVHGAPLFSNTPFSVSVAWSLTMICQVTMTIGLCLWPWVNVSEATLFPVDLVENNKVTQATEFSFQNTFFWGSVSSPVATLSVSLRHLVRAMVLLLLV